MADQIAQSASWRWLWNHYIYEGHKAGQKNDEIRRNLVEAFRKEVFDQVCFRLKVEDPEQAIHTPENEQTVSNIFKNAIRKWRRLVIECRKSPLTVGLIRESDLTMWDEDIPEEKEGRFEYEEAEDPEENYESPWDGDERTAEWPELAMEDDTGKEEPAKTAVSLS